MRERDIEKAFVDAVKRSGGEVRKVQWIGRRGAPDRVAMFPHGLLIWVELKAPGEKPEPHQEREHSRLRAMGQQVLVFDSIEGVERWWREKAPYAP